MTKQTRVVIVIPAFNEAATIGRVITDIFQYVKNAECIVVDDGSSDMTARVAQKAGATVIKKKRNEGSGKAIRTGLASLKRKKIDSVVLLDADGQHPPSYIPQLLSLIHQGKDYVIGSRYIYHTRAVTSPIRILGNRVISLLISQWFDCRVYDATSGYRAFSAEVLAEFWRQYPIVFSEPECIISLLEKRYSIGEVSVQMVDRENGTSSISPHKAIALMVYGLFIIGVRGALWRFGSFMK